MATLFLTAGLVLLNGMLFGFSTASIAGVVGTISEAFALSTRATEMMVTSLLAGCFVGAVLAAPISQRIGRRPSCLLAATLAFAGYALVPLGQAMAPGVGMLVAARILIGLGVGLSSMVVPMYAAEVTPARHRGAVVSLFQLAVTIGILLGYAVPLALTGHATWAQMLGGGVLIAGACAGAVLLLPESPRWLISRGRMAEGEAAAQRLGLAGEISAGDGESAPAGNWRAVLGRGSTKAVLVLCSVLFVLQNFSGIDGILYYAPHIFTELGFPAGVAALAATFGLGLVNVLATMAAMMLVDRLGRRPLLIAGSAAMAVSLALVIVAALADWPYVALAGLCAYIVAFALSLGPLPYVLMSELFPSAIRERGIAAASATSWLFNAIVAASFLSVVEGIGLAATIGIFLVVCVASLFISLAYVPETRQVELEDIEKDVLAGKALRRLGA
ncbi:SP family galactose:H+ symporter-like MFS transporter [Xanthobacter flavus]|uniref:SP family galactose:H+ symporter-like MFS transporter n=1 Tax=Xanthobacter flavus TaxID=281 RepID=A0ABU1KN11_XANFL|nr:sugar porter family MFS transporter [Xanthobacter flavus]MDR6335951.1 SP family galactose:H+ symporter-like MFS transporter [Xanthobacter flavus]